MSKTWIRFGVKAVLAVIVGLALLGAVVMLLWNALAPELFGWRAIGYWQALGVLVLCKILFGSWHGARGRMHWRARMMERWEKMSEAEREEFRAAMRRRCGRGAPPAESKS